MSTRFVIALLAIANLVLEVVSVQPRPGPVPDPFDHYIVAIRWAPRRNLGTYVHNSPGVDGEVYQEFTLHGMWKADKNGDTIENNDKSKASMKSAHKDAKINRVDLFPSLDDLNKFWPAYTTTKMYKSAYQLYENEYTKHAPTDMTPWDYSHAAVEFLKSGPAHGKPTLQFRMKADLKNFKIKLGVPLKHTRHASGKSVSVVDLPYNYFTHVRRSIESATMVPGSVESIKCSREDARLPYVFEEVRICANRTMHVMKCVSIKESTTCRKRTGGTGQGRTKRVSPTGYVDDLPMIFY